MADIHVLTGDGHGKINVVLHFDVPPGNNAVNVSWKDALLNSGISGETSMTIGVGAMQIAQAEADLIALGTRHEIHRTFPIKSVADTADARRDELRTFYTREKTEEIKDLQRRLKHAGYTEDIV